MKNLKSLKMSHMLFFISLVLIIYMPLHVIIAQSASLLTGGLEAWKAAKDVVLFVGSPTLLYLSYRRGLWQDRTFRRLLILGGLYALLHGLFFLLDSDDDVYSTIVASVYNTRLLGFLLLGYLVGSAKNGRRYLQHMLTAVVVVATAVALFGVAQYFLPHDLLTHVGYSVERGVRPLFFIDDKVDLPRVMSTLKDPNSFGSYLIVPILLTAFAVFKQKANKALFIRPFRSQFLVVSMFVQVLALILTFSRGAFIALLLSAGAIVVLEHRAGVFSFFKKHIYLLTALTVLVTFGFLAARNTYLLENVIYHSDDATVLKDPNQIRIELVSVVIDKVSEEPQGYGPGTAGLVSINNPNGTLLTENYYLQIAHEVGWLGISVFIALLSVIVRQLLKLYKDPVAQVLLASFVGYLFYSLLIHLWSNEAVALQWWLLCGVVLGLYVTKRATD